MSTRVDDPDDLCIGKAHCLTDQVSGREQRRGEELDLISGRPTAAIIHDDEQTQDTGRPFLALAIRSLYLLYYYA